MGTQKDYGLFSRYGPGAWEWQALEKDLSRAEKESNIFCVRPDLPGHSRQLVP